MALAATAATGSMAFARLAAAKHKALAERHQALQAETKSLTQQPVSGTGTAIDDWRSMYTDVTARHRQRIPKLLNENTLVLTHSDTKDLATIRIPDLEYDAALFEYTVLGDLGSILGFVGDMESRDRLLRVHRIQLQRDAEEIEGVIQVSVPNLEYFSQ